MKNDIADGIVGWPQMEVPIAIRYLVYQAAMHRSDPVEGKDGPALRSSNLLQLMWITADHRFPVSVDDE